MWFAILTCVVVATLLLAALSWNDAVGMSEFYMVISALVDGTGATVKLVFLLLFIIIYIVLLMCFRRDERVANDVIEKQSAELQAKAEIIAQQKAVIDERSTDLDGSEQNAKEQKSSLDLEVLLRSRAETTLRESQELLDCVNNIQSRFIVETDSGLLFDSMLGNLLRFTGSEYGFISEAREDEDGAPCLQVLAVFNITEASETRRLIELASFNFASSTIGEAPFIANGLEIDANIEGVPDGHPPLRAYLGIPLRRERRVVGYIGLANRTDGYDMNLVDRMAPVLTACTAQIENFRILEDHKVEVEIQKVEKMRINSILKSTHDGVITFDDGGKVVEFNPAAEAMFGIPAKDAMAKKIGDFVMLPGLSDSYRNNLQNYLDTEESREKAKRVELPAMRPDGHMFPVELTVAPFEFDRRRFFNAFLIDLRDRKEATEKVLRARNKMDQAKEQAEELKGELKDVQHVEERAHAIEVRTEQAMRTKFSMLSNMSHELRTPLNAIIGFSETILNDVFGKIESPQHKEYIQYVRDSAQQLLDHVSGVLDLSGSDDEEMEISPDDTVALGRYAKFSSHVQGDRDIAEALFQRAIELDPGNPTILSNYSQFRTSIRNDHERVDSDFQTAIDADPDNAHYLGNYAVFLSDVRSHHDRAEEFFKLALKADPHHAVHLCNYARFQTKVRGHHDRAETFYSRAVEAAPDNATILCDYALFLRNIRNDDVKTEALYVHAIKANPDDLSPRQAYAAFLLFNGQIANGEKLLEEVMPDLRGKDLLQALFFQFAYARTATKRNKALKSIHDVLENRVRCPLFDPFRDVRHLVANGHQEPELLEDMAQVITVREDIRRLERYPAWKALEKTKKEPV